MNVYRVTVLGKYRRPVTTITVAAESKPEAIAKVKAQAFARGARGVTIEKTPHSIIPPLTPEACAERIVKDKYMRIGPSVITWCYDGTVSVSDWNGHTKWFPKLSVEAILYFIHVQPIA